MNHAQSRRFEPVALGVAELHPLLVERIQSVRKNKRVRSLAKSAAHQLRHLIDLAAVEMYLNCAAMAQLEQNVDASQWLENQIKGILAEQVQTRNEHAIVSENLAALSFLKGAS